MNHVDKYYWIIDHPKMGDENGQCTSELTPHLVNPLTNTIEDDKSLNTKYQWWVEVLYQEYNEDDNDFEYCHDWDLDTGGDSAEEAIDNLYEIVLKKFGDY